VLKEWTSGTQAEEFTVNKGTEAGNAKYTLHEEAAPEGYLVATDITFEADSQGNITRTDATTVTDATIVMVDNAASKHGVSVSKQDVAGAELAGATLQIENANTGEVKDSWESDGAVHTVQLFPGAYKLVEKAAPEGYSLATAIAFTVGEDGVITVGETTLESNAPIVMVDAVADTPSTQDNPNNPVNPDTPDNPNTPNDEGSNLDNQNNSDNQGGNEDSSTADESDGSDVLADTGDSLLPVGLVVLVAVVGLGVLVIARLRSRSNK
jgi:hypothetical protein